MENLTQHEQLWFHVSCMLQIPVSQQFSTQNTHSNTIMIYLNVVHGFIFTKLQKKRVIGWAAIDIKNIRCHVFSSLMVSSASLSSRVLPTTHSSRIWWPLRIKCTVVRAVWWRVSVNSCSPALKLCWDPSVCHCWTDSHNCWAAVKPAPGEEHLHPSCLHLQL